ncbi:MAG: OmpH family outer membrane protein [Candidatus Hydrogenedentes bacterium]|nr:OmpH family outer membrane protein [Candidatus Hydrogenedentota bacterium]
MKFRALILPCACAAFVLSLLMGSTATGAETKEAPAAAPAAPVASGGYKIGVVSRYEALKAYDKRISEYKKLETERDTLQGPLNKMLEDIKADQKRYDDGKATMSETDRKALEDTIQAAMRDLQAESKKRQGQVDDKEKRVIEAITADFEKAVKVVGEHENYHLVLEGDDNVPNRIVLYFSDTIDMTPKVIEYLNSHVDSSAKAPAAPKTDKPAPAKKK